MNRITLIGHVGADYLRRSLTVDDGDATARFILDCLTADQTAAIARAILDDPLLDAQVEIKLPEQFVAGLGLPVSVLTNERATYFRNAPIAKPALLVTNTGDDEEQSLKELIPIGAPQLLEYTDVWVWLASRGLSLGENEMSWWSKALRGLQDLHLLSLDRFADYVVWTRREIDTEGYPLMTALGRALPALQMPLDSNYFNGLNEKQRGYVSRWKHLFGEASKKRACFLSKQTPTGMLLNRDDLTKAFAHVQDIIPENYHPRVETFIQSPSGWNQAASELAQCEWELVKPLFDGLRREKFSIGKTTFTFYNEREPELLTDNERDYLNRLIARKTTQADEEDSLFYEVHRNELRDDPKLKAAWDRFVFGAPRESEDFLAGLMACMEFLFGQVTNSTHRRLNIRSERRTKKDLKELNADAGQYFVRRYKGVTRLWGRQVNWDTGELFNYFTLVEEWRQAKIRNESQSRAALQLKFIITLEVEFLTGGSEKFSTQLIWKFNPLAVTSEFANDLSRLEKHPLVYCRASRESISTKGQFQSVDLSDVRTFVPTYGKDRGSFVAAYNAQLDIAKVWKSNLQSAVKDELLSQTTANTLDATFTNFKSLYTEALRGFLQEGLGHTALQTQSEAYGTLLEAVYTLAKGDRNRELLLRPLLHVGTVAISGTRPAAIVAPWHPLRLAAISSKAHLVARTIKQLLTLENLEFGDPRLFFTDLVGALVHPFYPEIVLGWYDQQVELLSVTDVLADYSLHESPVARHTGLDDTNENPSEAATRVYELVQRYLALQPHEQANLSVVLYNCDSARLPQAVVDKIGATHEDDEDVRCQIVVRHRDPKRLRTLYENIIESVDTDADSYNASEATQDFMARLRIGIMADQAPVPNEQDGRPNDIAFSQDVIARHARLEWYSESAQPYNAENLVPAQWSRRRPAAKDDMKSVVYLCCPAQTREGWILLTAMTTFQKGDWDGNVERRWLPARQLDFQDADTARIFEETHNLANWVVNYDELLDRRQLLNHKVRVIRYKQASTQGRNVIISSNAPLGLLRSMVLNRLKTLDLGLSESDYVLMTDRFIEDANDISGDIVLRAAKRGRHASELLGVVLSRYLIRRELGAMRYYGWYFLDDYATWLGQREEQIADILALSPEIADDGTLRLHIIISEAKYIDASNLATKRKESQKQLRDTLRRIHDAIFADPPRLDRSLWLARLSDLLLDGIQVPANAQLNLTDWRRAIREGTAEIVLRGYSHVFISGPAGSTEPGDFAQVATVDNAYQEVFSRQQVRELMMHFFQGDDPLPTRLQNADENIWLTTHYEKPSASYAAPDTEAQTTTVTGDATVLPKSVETTMPISTTNTSDDVVLSATTENPEKSSESVWAYPGLELLLESDIAQPNSDSDAVQMWLKQTENQVKGALQQFQLQAKIEDRVLTPNAALLKFKGSTLLTVEQVLKRRSEFLTTYGLNLISVQPEPGRIALAIERPQREIIETRDLWRDWQPIRTIGNQDLLIAVREDDGSKLFLSPGKQHAPHTLVAGSTGSGKSVLIQNILLSIAATNTAEEARIVLIDPKQGVDYFQFEGLPHLREGIIDDHEKALEHLREMVIEMDQRYTKFKAARSSNLAMYNQKVARDERLPVIWLIHDEFAEWMMMDEYKQEVTSLVGRLGVKARAAGIYLIFAAQRPDANVMPMQLRANLGNRLILRVDSEGTSDIALGERGAERLLGRGHMIAKLEGLPGLSFAQVPFADPDFVEQVVALISEANREM